MKTKNSLRNCIRRLITSWAVPVGCGLFFLILLKFVFIVGVVPSISMEPTIKEDSFIIGVRIIVDLKLGDVIVFKHEDRLLVKRIAALPGDVVVIGGEAIVVPDDCYYMLGDNMMSSFDSRCWVEPFVAKPQIVALLPFY